MKRTQQLYSAIGGLLLGIILLAALPIYGTGLAQDITITPTDQPTSTPTETPTATPTDIPLPTPTNPAPTLVPPTPLPPVPSPTPQIDVSASALANAQTTQTLRVGTYYNAYPFVWLNENGEVVGYEADIINAIGIELGVTPEYIQVTRHNAEEALLSGEVDMLIGQQIHSRDREAIMEFSHPYYLNAERMVVTQDSPYTILTDLANLPISVEIGSRSERALRDFSDRTGVTFDIRTYFSESEALDALANGEVQGMLGELDNLLRAGRQQMRLIDEPVLIEPYAIAMRHGDINLRNIINRSLQRLKASGRMDQIFNSWFSGTNPNWNFTLLIPVYETLYGDERSLSQFNTDMPTAANPIAQRIRDGQPIRVAGIYSEGETAPAGIRFISSLNRAMIEEMARRWNAQIEYIPNSALNAADLVANGQADIAVGISPRWDGADRVEYSRPYIEHSDRLMVPARSDITGFSDMLGTRWVIGYFADDATDADLIQQAADYFRVGQNIRIFEIINEDQGIHTMVVEDNIRAIYGDSLRLMALQQEESDPSVVKILDHPYGDILPITFAVPRGDVEFLDIVDATLQSMAQDGTYQNLWSANFGQGTPLTIVTWPEKNPDPQ